MTKTIVLTSSKNFRWLSMQEIIPYITDSWKSLEDENHIVKVIDIDEVNIFKMMKDILDVDNIVCTCFTVEIIRIVTTFRKKMGLDFKSFFYVHGQATIAMWPFLKWGGEDFLTNNDFLVVSCKRDISCLEISFNEPNVLLHPFLLKPKYKLNAKLKDSNFIYIGRVSEQKNLHTILLAISLISKEMRENKSSFKIIGGADSLGTPVTGKLPIDYLNYLKELVKSLEINDLVDFVGHIDRKDFSKYLENQNATFISASLHSDENFGMAPFQYLWAGGRAILTDWGGYADFSDYFTNVSYLPVALNDNGAYCQAGDIARAMLSSMKSSQENNPINIQEEDILLQLKKQAVTKPDNREVTSPSSISLDILAAREEFYAKTKSEDRNHGSQIFEGFSDPLFLRLSQAYGAKVVDKLPNGKEIKILPYVTMDKNSIFINDPHKGKSVLERNGEPSEKIKSSLGEEFELSLEEVKSLYKLGCVTFLS